MSKPLISLFQTPKTICLLAYLHFNQSVIAWISCFTLRFKTRILNNSCFSHFHFMQFVRNIVELVSELLNIYCPLQFFNGLLVSLDINSCLKTLVLLFTTLYILKICTFIFLPKVFCSSSVLAWAFWLALGNRRSLLLLTCSVTTALGSRRALFWCSLPTYMLLVCSVIVTSVE